MAGNRKIDKSHSADSSVAPGCGGRLDTNMPWTRKKDPAGNHSLPASLKQPLGGSLWYGLIHRGARASQMGYAPYREHRSSDLNPSTASFRRWPGVLVKSTALMSPAPSSLPLRSLAALSISPNLSAWKKEVTSEPSPHISLLYIDALKLKRLEMPNPNEKERKAQSEPLLLLS